MFLVTLHRSGPQWGASKPLEEQSGCSEHAAFTDGLVDEGFIVLGGPPTSTASCTPSRPSPRTSSGRDPWSETHLRVAAKLRIPPSDTDHRRVLAVLAYLQSQA
jgi:hypothetical protein